MKFSLKGFVIALLFVCQCAFANSAQFNSVKRLRLNRLPKSWQYVFDLARPANYSYFTLSNPARLVVDFKKTNYVGAKLSSSLWRSTLVKDIRVAKKSRDVLRFVFDLYQKQKAQFQQLKPSSGRGYRLVVALQKDGALSASKLTSSFEQKAKAFIQSHLPKAKPKKVKTIEMPKPVKAHASSASRYAYRKQHTVKKAPVKAVGERKIMVVIDPGHGGKDPGATGPNGIHEKNVVLKISRDLQADINKQPGFKAVLTRTGDYFIPLRKRLAIARDYRADMFIAIHADAFKNRNAYGASVFALSQRGATSEAARWLARRENASELMGGVDLTDKGRVLKSVLLDLSQTATISASLKIGRDIIGSLKKVAPLHHGRVEQAAFVVLKSPDIPSLLVETGFISNYKEERRLNSRYYQKRIANALMLGIRRYFEWYPPRGTWLYAHRKDKRRYTVARGDTLSEIASKYGVSVRALVAMNNLKNQRIRIGQVLYIPVMGV